MDSEHVTSVEVLLDRARSLEEKIRELQEERADCLRDVNARRVATNVLPNEVLAAIFLAASPPIDFDSMEFSIGVGDYCDEYVPTVEEMEVSRPEKEEDFSFRYFPLVVSAVCVMWRQVALSMPQLWTSLSLKITHKSARHKTDLLQFYIEHSGDLPFSLGLDMWRYFAETQGIRCSCGSRMDKFPPDKIVLEPLRKVIFDDYVEKFQLLRLAHPPIEWATLIPQRPFFAEDFAIGWSTVDCEQPIVDLGIPSSGSLRKLSFDSTWWSPIPTIPSSVTVVHLRAVDVRQAVRILFTCPQLVEYRYREPVNAVHPDNLEPPLNLQPLVLSNIRMFEWSWCDLPYHYDVTTILRLPNVRHLRWSRLPQERLANGRPSESRVQEFFTHLPEDLDTFEFYDMGGLLKDFTRVHKQLLYHIFTHLSRIRTIGFIHCGPKFIDFFISTFGHRTPTRNLMRNAVLGDLEQISIRDMGFPDWNYDPHTKVPPKYVVKEPFVRFMRAQAEFSKSRNLCICLEGCLINCHHPYDDQLLYLQQQKNFQLRYKTGGQVHSSAFP
ncbi:hypothetical protein D9756_002717 [Leucocoprinus leucothites]|uniref:F-box domain-containing protein n=1 Tax=Leucocoprinus leucothites TaxID=201217 RepID=A0A8H5LME3_9AGAR|nr:hypothetical protein D9756_002717 [Leucoagaricus leucothites]